MAEPEKTETEIAAESKAAEDVATEIVAQEEKMEEKVADNLHKVFEEGKSLDMSAEPKSETDEPTPVEGEEKPAESDVEGDGPTPAEAAEEAKIEAEQAAKEAEDTSVTDEKDEATEVEAGKAEVKSEEKIPELSEAYYRAAIHMGWTDEDIKASLATNPKLATKTFANIYETVNRSSKEFAEIGQAKRETAEAAEAAQKVEPGKPAASEYKPTVDIEQLRRDNPGDPMVDMIAAQQEQNKLIADQLEAMKTVAPASAQVDVSAEKQRALNQESAAIQQQVEGFFKGDEAKPYAEFYGVIPKDGNWDSLTPGEKANRWAVIDMMDQMIVGAESFGKVMEIDEAMRRAHLSVSEPLREKVIREGIMGKVVKRSNGISLKPSSTAKPAAATGPKTLQDLEAATEERLRKVF